MVLAAHDRPLHSWANPSDSRRRAPRSDGAVVSTETPDSLESARSRWGWWEAGVVVALGLLYIVLVVFGERGDFFHIDAWKHLLRREIGSVSDIMAPVGGQIAIYNTIVMRIAYGVFGLSYSPWYSAIGATVWALTCGLAWWVLRRRGVHPIIRVGVVALMLFLWTGDFLAAWFIGNPVGLCAGLGALLLVVTVENPEWRHVGLLFLIAVAAVGAGGVGLGGVLSIAVALLLARRIRRWWPALVGSVLLYVVWYVFERESTRILQPSFGPEAWLETGLTVVDMLRRALARLLLLPIGFGWPLLVLLVAVVAWLAWRRRIDLFSGTLLLWMIAYLAMAAFAKVVPGVQSAGVTRYSFYACVLLLLAFAPLLRIPSIRWVQSTVVVGVAVLTAANGWLMWGKMRSRVEIHDHIKPRLEAVARLLDNGEPHVPFRLSISDITDEELLQLVVDGWEPRQTLTESSEKWARGQLRMETYQRRQPGYTTISESAVTDALLDDGCVSLPAEDSFAVHVLGASVLRLEVSIPMRIRLRWEDSYGLGTMSVDVEDVIFLVTAEPDGLTLLQISSGAETSLEVCGLGSV